jgi:hypothetical protein
MIRMRDRRRTSSFHILALRTSVGKRSLAVFGTAVGLVLLLLSMGLGGGRQPGRAAFSAASCVWHDPALQAEEQRAVSAVWAANLSRRYAIVHPSRAYAGVWLRDSFWTFLAEDDPSLAGRALQHFGGHQRASGQVPTQFVEFLRRPLYRDDESTLLYLIWADWQSQHHSWRPAQASLTRALVYVRQHAHSGRYVSQAGSYADWFDGYRLPQADTLSYMQGLYADALLAAQALRLNVSTSETASAVAAYRALADPPAGYLRFSRLYGYHDISGLTGEFLAQWLFGRPLLSDATIAATLHAQPSYGSGFRVVTNADGTYLSPHLFITHEFPGDYQNGGSWLLYDYMALATGCAHHVAGTGEALAARLRLEFRHGAVLHEYLNTDPTSPLAGSEPAYRDTFSWDTFIVRVDRFLRTRATLHAQPTHVASSARSTQVDRQGECVSRDEPDGVAVNAKTVNGEPTPAIWSLAPPAW